MSWYILSVLYLFVSFLLYPKCNRRLSIIGAIVYSIGVFFCYNTVVVYFNYLFYIQGSFLIFSIINFFIGSIMMIFIFGKKRIQKYFFQKQEFFITMAIIVVLLGIGCYRFRGFQAISYESGDSAIHYHQALCFSKELSLLDEKNSKNPVYGSFSNTMSISYVNAGIILRLFSNIKSYKVFLGYDVFCLILCSLLFFFTMLQVLKERKKIFLYLFFITLVYTLAYPLNSFLFGFCYLGLGVMVVNLLYVTILLFEKNFSNQFLFKFILLFVLILSVFFSYYLFVPCIYLALGLYYIYLWKIKKITFHQLLLYGSVTLILPFVLGLNHFFISTQSSDLVGSTVSNVLSMEGYGYKDITIIYIFVAFSWYMFFLWFKKKKKDNVYFNLNLLVLFGYIMLFFSLYTFHFISSYYFFKLFYLSWLFFLIGFGKLIISYRKYLYMIFCIILISCFYVLMEPDTKVTKIFTWLDIYHWNTSTFSDDKIIYTKGELELIEKSKEYGDMCEQNHRFLILGEENKNIWFYSITGMIPSLSLLKGDSRNLYLTPNPTLETWNTRTDYDCAIDFYEGKPKNDIEKGNFEILYFNKEGAILRK